jgi:hypothetical protein
VYEAELARETYADYYRLRYPHDADEAGRPRRLSPLHGRQQDAGAVFGTKAGWERADHYEPEIGWRRSGRDQRAFGYTEPPVRPVVAEAIGARAAGLIDLVLRQARGQVRHRPLQWSAPTMSTGRWQGAYSQWLDARASSPTTVTRSRTRFGW